MNFTVTMMFIFVIGLFCVVGMAPYKQAFMWISDLAFQAAFMAGIAWLLWSAAVIVL